MLCEYAVDKSTVMVKRLDCKLCDSGCGFWRWCDQKQSPVMSNFYIKYGCKVKKEYENKKKGGE